MANSQEAIREVMNLGRHERAALAVRLLASLEETGAEVDAAEWDVLWENELERRVAQIESGQVAMIPAAEVHDRLQAITPVAISPR